MINNILRIGMTVLLLLVSIIISGENKHEGTTDYTVLSMPNTSKLPVNEIIFVFQDSEGYMWYGTPDGLCRDDGYDIRVFRSDFESPNVMVRNQVNYIAEDGGGHIWFSTLKGVYTIDKHSLTISPVLIDDFPLRFYTILLGTQEGHMLVCGLSQLYEFDQNLNLLKKEKLSSDVAIIYEDSNANLFMAVHGDGLYFKSHSENSKWEMVQKGLIPTSFAEDVTGDGYWVGDNGIAKLRRKGNGWELTHLATPADAAGQQVSFFTKILQDSQTHNLWCMSYYNGLIVTDTLGHSLPLHPSIVSINSSTMSCMFADRGGNLWCSWFDTGMNIITRNRLMMRAVDMQPLMPLSRNHLAVKAFVREDDDVYWISQDRTALTLYDATTGHISSYFDNPSLRSLQLYQVLAMKESHTPHAVWVAFYGNKLVKLQHDQSGHMTLLDDASLFGLPVNSGEINCMVEDKDGNMWIGAQNGLFYFDAETKKVEETEVKEHDVVDMHFDGKGNLWVGLHEGGLVRIDCNTGSSTTFLLETDISTLDISNDGTIWLATGNSQLMAFRPDDEQLTDYTPQCGLNGNAINDIIVDATRHIWVVSNQQIFVFAPQTGASFILSTFDKHINLSRILPHSVYYDKKADNLYLGGISGIIEFACNENVKANANTNAKVFITDIKVSNHSIWPDSEFDANEPIQLKAKDQNIEISFSSLNFIHANTLRYAYRLLGLQDEWIYTDIGRNTAVFNNLPKGNYRFQVKVIGEDGLWGDQFTELLIHRQPAWYETVWAYIIYILLGVALLVLLASAYRQRVKNKSEKQMVEELAQTKLRYFTSISHELLTPLAVISSINETLQPADEQQRAKLMMVKSNINRLKHLLQQVIDFRKVESQNMQLYVQYGNLSQFVEQRCKDSFIPLAEGKHISLSIQKPMSDIVGYFDADKIEKILFNLVSNAIKYTPEGRNICIQLATTSSSSTAVIAIQDEGIGIENKELNKIFNRFYSSKRNDASLSNGIGLSLSKELIEIHHGSISVDSQLHKGSTFTIQFPITREAYSKLEIKDVQEVRQLDLLKLEINRKATEMPRPETDLTLLIVEDNVELLAAMREILSHYYYVHTALNGEEAISLLQQRDDISFVVTDISMPRMDGLELCNRIKGNIATSHIAVIVLTAMISTEKQVETYNAGADAYLPKPFEVKVLQALIKNLHDQLVRRQTLFRTNPNQLNAQVLEVSSIDTQLIQKAIDLVMENLTNPQFDVEYLATSLCMSRSTLARKLKATTGDTPFDFLRMVKLKYAYQLLQQHRMTVTEVYEAVGYTDHRTFANAFKEAFGIMPGKV